MKLAIVGSRNYDDLWRVVHYVRSLPMDTVIVSGGARGVDATAAKIARQRGLEVIELLPDWERYGKAAGMIRNSQIVDQCDELTAFWDGVSKGTKNSIDKAKAAGKPVKVIS